MLVDSAERTWIVGQARPVAQPLSGGALKKADSGGGVPRAGLSDLAMAEALSGGSTCYPP